MATYDMTLNSTVGVGANSIAAYPSDTNFGKLRVLEATLDIAKLVAAGYTCANGDIFQLLEIPADSFVLVAGAEVVTVFNGTTPTVDIDFAAGDDLVDGGDVATAGWLAAGTNGQGWTVPNAAGAASTFTQLVTTTDTIDVKLIAGSSDVTSGVLRVVAVVIDLNHVGGASAPTEVTRDQLA